jgi:hypothetical protein
MLSPKGYVRLSLVVYSVEIDQKNMWFVFGYLLGDFSLSAFLNRL